MFPFTRWNIGCVYAFKKCFRVLLKKDAMFICAKEYSFWEAVISANKMS